MSVRCDACYLYLPNSTAYDVHRSSRTHREASARLLRGDDTTPRGEQPVPCDGCGVFLHNTAAYEIHRSSREHREATMIGLAIDRDSEFGDSEQSVICDERDAFISDEAFEAHISGRLHRVGICTVKVGRMRPSPRVSRGDSNRSKSTANSDSDLREGSHPVNVSDKDCGVDFGTLDIDSLTNLPTISRSLTLHKLERGGKLALRDIRVSSDTHEMKVDSSFMASLVGQTRWITYGEPVYVEVAFKPVREGRHNDVLTLVFHDVSNRRYFNVTRALHARVKVKPDCDHVERPTTAGLSPPEQPSSSSPRSSTSANAEDARWGKTTAGRKKPLSAEEENSILRIGTELGTTRDTILPLIQTFMDSLDSTPAGESRNGNERVGVLEREHMRIDDLLEQAILRLDNIVLDGEWNYARRDRKDAIREVQGWLDILENACQVVRE